MAAARPRTRAKSAPSRLPLLLTHTISSLAGTCALAAELASGVGSTARIPGLAPAATGADAGLLAVRGGRANGLTIGGSGPHFRYFCEEAIMRPCASAGGSAAAPGGTRLARRMPSAAQMPGEAPGAIPTGPAGGYSLIGVFSEI